MKTYEHLHPSAAKCAELDAGERVLWLRRPRWIGYPRAQEVLGRLEDLLRHPREARMPNMLLIGGTNNGKTRLIRSFAQRHPAEENPHGEHIVSPVLYVQAPPTPTEAGFYSEILNTLFEKVPTSSTDAKRARVVQVLRGIQLKVLIVDELHNILAGASVKQQQFLNMIKYLGNELQISVVGCGTGDLLRAVSIDPQIQNRFVPELLPRWQMNKEFRQLLMSFERVLPLRNPSDLHDPQLAGKLLAMCEGTIGELSMLLNMAATHAIQQGCEQISAEVLNACGYVAPSDRTRQAARA
ncbi:TniB family NTP-binding protein [Pandoraea commovens]|uniref:TniB family NTP-binding protein n=1 Tax=Pandoraea commovens TaxID=2508289 RepID=A0ABY5QI06_9BURK|nr:TniB family NTP-binding protein [Pandoraea commovens]UVA79983.1 TniB family NTP-binding protein [Pandoraea commovens]